jgi:SNF2 family DNA or RNA helicase
MVIMDEAHRIGSPRSRQTKAIIKKFEFVPYKYIVTGTLNANNLMSFYMPYRFLGPDTVPYANFYEFRRQYMKTVDPDGYMWKPLAGSINKVKKIIGNLAVSFTKDECLDLPPVIYQRLSCKMEKYQAELYKQMKNDLIAEIDDMCDKCNKKNNCDASCESQLVAKNSLVAAQKLRQIACGFYINTRINVDESGKETRESNIIKLNENPKLDLLAQTLNNIPEEKQVIIWANYIYANKIIAERLSKAFGEDSYLTCYENDDAFEKIGAFKKTGRRFMVTNPSKMGVGHNIQFSHYQVFFSNSHSWIERNQAESRQHRKGQNNKVTIIDLVVDGTIDELIIDALLKKQDLSMTLSELALVLRNIK